MDTVNPAKADVSGMINEIKDYMPAVYAAIKARAAVVGNGAGPVWQCRQPAHPL